VLTSAHSTTPYLQNHHKPTPIHLFLTTTSLHQSQINQPKTTVNISSAQANHHQTRGLHLQTTSLNFNRHCRTFIPNLQNKPNISLPPSARVSSQPSQAPPNLKSKELQFCRKEKKPRPLRRCCNEEHGDERKTGEKPKKEIEEIVYREDRKQKSKKEKEKKMPSRSCCPLQPRRSLQSTQPAPSALAPPAYSSIARPVPTVAEPSPIRP
jgi:hypothetical protein